MLFAPGCLCAIVRIAVRLWCVGGGCSDHDEGVSAVAFSPDGTWVAAASGDRSARVFDAATGAETSRLRTG